jgi:imidazoleglycerol phosphate dehydratase HisB
VIVDATVHRIAGEPGATVYFGQYGDGEHDMEAEFDSFAGAMRAAVNCGGIVTLVVTP